MSSPEGTTKPVLLRKTPTRKIDGDKHRALFEPALPTDSSSIHQGAADGHRDYRKCLSEEYDSRLAAENLKELKQKSSSSSNMCEALDTLEGELAEMSVGDRRALTRSRRTKSLYGASPSNKFGPKASLMKNQSSVLTIQDPGSQRLTWYKTPLSVLIIKKIHDESVIHPFMDICLWLMKEKDMIVYVEAKVLEDPFLQKHSKFSLVQKRFCTFKEGEDDLTDKIDLIVTMGGDGTLLYASSLFQASLPPVMAFHLGSLGFLSPFDFDSSFQDRVTQVLEGNVPLILRTRLKGVVCPKGSRCITEDFKKLESKKHIMILNEVVVDRGPSAFLCNIDLYIEQRHITSVQGDGVIIATTTGSTAYSAAAGASMVHPNVPAIVITPICPHSLSFRPIVVPAGVEIKVMVSPDARNNAWVSFDGRNRQEIEKGDELRISTSIYPLPSICSEDQIGDWFDSLAGCLHWNVRKQQKAFHSHTPSPESNGSSHGNSNSNR